MFFCLRKLKAVQLLIFVLTLALMLGACGKKDVLIAKGVAVAGIAVGDMTEQQAVSSLKKYENFAKDAVIDFICDGVSFEIPASQLDLKLDAKKTAHRCFLVGRGNDKKTNKEEIKKARTEGININPVLFIDRDKLVLAAENNLGDRIIDPAPMTVNYGEDCLVVTNSREGNIVDVDKAMEALENELSDFKADNPVEIVLTKHKPDNLSFEQFKKKYVQKAKDAVYTKDGDTYHIEPEVIGVEIDEEEARRIFEENKNSTDSYKIPAKITRPQVTASYLEDKYVNKIMAKYSTSFAGSSEGRCANIALAASKIDGYVVNPGERFSYNKVVGPRTAEAGFRLAHVYVGTKVVDGIGGGICQVSSALYNAVVMADLKTVSRTNHSIPVDYVPRGRDATVSYGTIDYVFENNKPYPVSIKAKIDGTNLTVSIVGTSEMDYTVEFVSNYVSAIEYTTVQTEDDTIPKGETKVITAGSNGSVYESYRVYKKNGEEYDRKFESRSRYQPVTAEVAVGTMEEESEEEAPSEDLRDEEIQEETPMPEAPEETGEIPAIPEITNPSDITPDAENPAVESASEAEETIISEEDSDLSAIDTESVME